MYYNLVKSQFVEFSYEGLSPRSLVWKFPPQDIPRLSVHEGRNLRYAGRGSGELSFSLDDL